jgi:hypothetical protein
MRRCSRCQRVNPADAAYCHFDGADLQAPGGEGPPGRLPHDFVFPTGRRCRTYTELALALQDEWGTGRELLARGVFRQFLTAAGRLDLAHAAEQAERQADGDIGLSNFLERLPAADLPAPRLDLHPRRFALGPLPVGEQVPIELRVTNQGRGLLHGNVKVMEGGGWIVPISGNGDGPLPIKTTAEQVLRLAVDTRGLAAPQTYQARLAVITNGGIVEVPVRIDLAARPFPHEPFAGATSPRDLASRMRTQPRAAAPLLESGAVARWFTANGWIYPLVGAAAPGVAGVQQFFEALGLARPPVVRAAAPVITVRTTAPELAFGQIELRTGERKWIYAWAETDAPWIQLPDSQAAGPQQADLPFAVDTARLEPGRVHEGEVGLIVNGGRRLRVRVRVEVGRPPAMARPAWLGPVLAGAVVGGALRLVAAVPADLVGRLLTADAAALADGPAAFWARPPDPAALVHAFVVTTGWLGGLAGWWVLHRRGEEARDGLFGLVAGLGAGAALAATAACLLPVPDALARLLWRGLGFALRYLGPGAAAVAWVALAVGTWAALGAAAGWLVHRVVPGGQRWLAAAGGWLRRRGGTTGAERVQPVLPPQ